MNFILSIDKVSKFYDSPGQRRPIIALHHVSLKIKEGTALGLVGESGAGKSTLARMVIGSEMPSSGRIWFDGEEVTAMSARRRHAVKRWIQMIWQDPAISLNPFMNVEELIREPLEIFRIGDRRCRKNRVIELLERTGLPVDCLSRRPHELSGGQCQRVAIARALSLNPRLLICDEIMIGLDVIHQKQILELLKELQAELGLTILFISHDLLSVRFFCHRVAVIRDGRIIEEAEPDALFRNPAHPYSAQLVRATLFLSQFSVHRLHSI